jgi:predicted esterase
VAHERTIPATLHGRYLLDVPSGHKPTLWLTGFHGYGEQAAIQLDRLRAVRGDASCGLISIQGLHRFYRGRGESVVASWMTRENRDLMIADNVAYVDAVLDAVALEIGPLGKIVHVGFSQGASMAHRSAAGGRHRAAGVIALGGDVPPELSGERLANISRALIGWPRDDEFYTAAKRDADASRLQGSGVVVTVVPLEGGHEWSEAFTQSAAAWLRQFA